MARIKLIIGIIILIAVLLIVIDLSEETTLQIRKFDISKSNTSEYVIDYNATSVDIAIVNITQEELSKYPALEMAIDCANKTGYDSSCKVSTDDWKKIKDFIQSKYRNLSYGDVSPCIKFGEKYGESCYKFIFIR